MRMPTSTSRQMMVRVETTASGTTVLLSTSTPPTSPMRDSWLLFLPSGGRGGNQTFQVRIVQIDNKVKENEWIKSMQIKPKNVSRTKFTHSGHAYAKLIIPENWWLSYLRQLYSDFDIEIETLKILFLWRNPAWKPLVGSFQLCALAVQNTLLIPQWGYSNHYSGKKDEKLCRAGR